jgi:hypothetical protein
MMDGSFQVKVLNSELLSSFDQVGELSCFEVNNDDDRIITAFVWNVETVIALGQHWEEVIDYVSSDYLATVLNEFEVWNSYLFFICKEKVPKSLMYKIENDKYSMRKVVDFNIEELSEKDIIKLLNRKVLSTHINYAKSKNKHKSSIIKPTLSVMGENLIDSNISLIRNENSKKQREEWLLCQLKEEALNEN